MCNLYAQRASQADIRKAARATHDLTGNLPAMPAIFPDHMAPIVRSAGQNRELVMARWGFPPPAFPA